MLPKPVKRTKQKARLRSVGKSGSSIRRHAQARAWSLCIKSRGGCQACGLVGVRCKGEIDPAHVFPKGKYPHLAYRPENGLCLCRAHHDWSHETRANMVELAGMIMGPEAFERLRLDSLSAKDLHLGTWR